MTLCATLAETWATESALRATRAAAAVAGGKATAAQAQRDQQLCTEIARMIATDFARPVRATHGDAALNLLFDANDLMQLIARGASRLTPHGIALHSIAAKMSGPATITLAGCWIAHELDRQGWPKNCEPGPIPRRWRLPV